MNKSYKPDCFNCIHGKCIISTFIEKGVGVNNEQYDVGTNDEIECARGFRVHSLECRRKFFPKHGKV